MIRCTRRAAAVLALLAVSLLSGCVSIPASGPVVPGRTQDGAGREPRRLLYASPPQPGDSPTAIVSGFLRAAADFSADHSVARSYITPDRQRAWRPDSPVVVHGEATGRLPFRVIEVYRPQREAAGAGSTGPADEPSGAPSGAASGSPSGSSGVPSPSGDALPDPEPGARVTVEVQVPVLARVGTGGVYHPAGRGEVEVLTFHLVPVDGQWRISDPADGVVVSWNDFQYTFAHVPLYFQDRVGDYLVPDLRWFPVTSAPSVVVAALLDGAVPWLQPAVTSGAPLGTELTATGVRAAGTALVVDLTIRAKEGAPEQRRVLLAQLQATLTEAARSLYFVADEVRVTVEQARFEVPSAAPAPSLPTLDGTDRRPVALDAQNRLNRVSATRGTPVPDLPALAGEVSRPAVATDSSSYAALTENRSRLVVLAPGVAPRILLRSAGMTTPSYDVHGWIWTSPAENAGEVYTVPRAGSPVTGTTLVRVKAPWLRGHRVDALRLSVEGARAVVVASHQGRSMVYVCGVVRDEDGVPQALTDPPQQLVRDLAVARDASWLDAQQVSILGSRRGVGDLRQLVVQVGGQVSEGIPLPDAVSITSRENPDALWVQTPAGAAYRSGAGLLAVPGMRWPTVPG